MKIKTRHPIMGNTNTGLNSTAVPATNENRIRFLLEYDFKNLMKLQNSKRNIKAMILKSCSCILLNMKTSSGETANKKAPILPIKGLENNSIDRR